jgi:hypothetical protein
MKIDYKALSKENVTRYGTDIGDWADELLANLYRDRTHFVFELLQNAEDALRRRGGQENRSVRFELFRDGLRVFHFGQPFDEADVRGICGINKSTKRDELTAIGRFGIGFKSVYAVTRRPEVRSAGQHFAIESYVHPVEIAPIDIEDDSATVFWLPFKPDDEQAFAEIEQSLEKLNARSLLFLREVEEIEWTSESGVNGKWSRVSREMDQGLRRVTLLGTTSGGEDSTSEDWLVFSQPVASNDAKVGWVEIAYRLDAGDSDAIQVVNINDSELAVFFPTNMRVDLGVLLQGPYRTTPARDNVHDKDSWNQHLVRETSTLLVESLETLKSLGALTVDALCGLAIDERNFAEGTMFRPLYDGIADALRRLTLLPSNKDCWTSSKRAVLSRGDHWKFIGAAQLTALFGEDESLQWLAQEITADRTPILRQYLMEEHGVREITPQILLSKMSKEFLEAQSDEWIKKLYIFLLGQQYLLRTNQAIANMPWVRLEDGTHVAAYKADHPNAFLPSKVSSGFPTVRAEVCRGEALAFLKDSLKLTEPDPVDDVIANILPLYNLEDRDDLQVDLALFPEHLKAIETAYGTPLRYQREKLVSALAQRRWVPAVDNDGKKDFLMPFECYLPTEKLKRLFEGISDIDFVDTTVPGMQGASIRDILIACGAERYLANEPVTDSLNNAERNELRQKYGDPGCSGHESEDDRTLYGLDKILDKITQLPFEEAKSRSSLLWEALADVVQDKRENVVKATYSWFYYSNRSMEHDAEFIRDLRSAKWVPDSSGVLVAPEEIVFENIDPAWAPNAVLQTVLKFMPSTVEILAQAFDMDPNMLRLLKRSGIASESELAQRLGLVDLVPTQVDDQEVEADSAAQNDAGTQSGGGSSAEGAVGGGTMSGLRSGGGGRSPSTNSAGQQQSGETSSNRRANSGQTLRGRFISYLAVDPLDEEDEDISDTESHEERMRVEAIAIEHILRLEPELKRTATGNAGFDLYGDNDDGHPNRWIEVKAMVGTLSNHPVGMSKRQFEMAQEKKTRFWLYVVENATSISPRILKIQDPAGNARTFTFDEVGGTSQWSAMSIWRQEKQRPRRDSP